MTMAKKMLTVAAIVTAVIVTILLMTVLMPAINGLVDIAKADPSAANYTAYSAALGSAPLWMYFIPVLIGGVAVILILRMPETQ
jgi:hypothetical protein